MLGTYIRRLKEFEKISRAFRPYHVRLFQNGFSSLGGIKKMSHYLILQHKHFLLAVYRNNIKQNPVCIKFPHAVIQICLPQQPTFQCFHPA